jgi:hypothetical protein
MCIYLYFPTVDCKQDSSRKHALRKDRDYPEVPESVIEVECHKFGHPTWLRRKLWILIRICWHVDTAISVHYC